MTVKSIISSLVLVGLGLMVEGSAQAGFFVSGAAGVGNTDANTTFSANPAGNGEFASPGSVITGGAFATQASIVNPFAVDGTTYWYSGGLSNGAGTANWLSPTTAAGNQPGTGVSAIYAINLGTLSPAAGTEYLTLTLAVDNLATNIWINSQSNLIASNSNSIGGANLTSLTTVTYTISASEIVSGTNYLYIDVVNTGATNPLNPEGILFAGSITVPEPASMAMVAIGGLMGVVGFRVRRKRSVA